MALEDWTIVDEVVNEGGGEILIIMVYSRRRGDMMKMKYDREGDVLDILIRDGQIHHAEDHGQVIINYDDENRVVKIEILNASKVFGSILAEALKVPRRKSLG